MFEFHEKRKIRGLLYSKVTLVLLFIVSALIFSSVVDLYYKEKEARMRKAQTQRELEDIKKRETAIVEEINRLRSGRGLEEEIRQKFEVSKEGEEIIVIVDAPENKEDGIKSQDSGFFSRIFNLF